MDTDFLWRRVLPAVPLLCQQSRACSGVGSDTFYSKNLVDGLVNSDMKKISNKSSLIGTYVR